MNDALRLNKVLAQLGYGSRRQVDRLIEAGQVTVNNQIAKLGQKVESSDILAVRGKTVARREVTPVLVALNKPKDVTTTKKDRFAKVTVMDYLPPRLQHLYPIGRLDRDSRGLILLTNDGDLAKRLTHPKFAHEKEYEIELVPIIHIPPKKFQSDINRLQSEIIDPELQSTPPKVIHADYNPHTQRGKVKLILTEGKKRQIRRLFRVLGYHVTDLLRTRIGGVHLASLKEGEYVIISPSNV